MHRCGVDIQVLMRRRGVNSLAEPKNPKVNMRRLTLLIRTSSIIIRQLVNGLVVILPFPSFNSTYARPPAQT